MVVAGLADSDLVSGGGTFRDGGGASIEKEAGDVPGEKPPDSNELETADDGTSGSPSCTRCPDPLAVDDRMYLLDVVGERVSPIVVAWD